MTKHASPLISAIALALGTAAVPQTASAVILDFAWDGVFTMLDPTGNALANISISSKANQFQTAVSGTMSFDTATMVPFDLLANPPPSQEPRPI